MASTFNQNVKQTTGAYANDYLWSVATNWSTGVVPGALDSVLLNLTKSGASVVDNAIAVASVTFNTTGSLLVGGALTTASVGVATNLSADTLSVLSGASLQVNGTLALGYNSEIDVAGTLGATTLAFTPSGTTDLSSRLVVTAGSLTVSSKLDLTGVGSASLAAGATMQVGNLTMSSGTFDIAGTANIVGLALKGTGLTIEGSATVGQLGGGTVTINRGGALELTSSTNSFLSSGGDAFTLNGGTLTLDASVSLISGSSFLFGATASNGASRLDIADPADFSAGKFTAAIQSLDVGDSLQFGTAQFSAASYSSASHSVTLTGSGGTASETLSSVTLAAGITPSFSLSTAANGGTVVTLNCFLAGTRIETPSGPAAIETLSPGDLVLAVEDGVRVASAIRWVGERRVERASLDPAWLDTTSLDALPVRIRAHAFADDVPCRDLLITAEHCILDGGYLIPARMLVNGASIVHERSLARYSVHHIECERHSILLAEGLTAESYLDTGDRDGFAAPDAALRQCESRGRASWAKDAAAPLATAREAVEPVWRRLAARAEALGMEVTRPGRVGRITRDPALRLQTDHALLRARRSRGGRHLFVLPAGSRRAILRSRSGVPAEIEGPFVDDRRRLGVCVRSATLWTGRGTELALAADGLGGWHPAERPGEGCWTDGAAELALPALAQATVLEIELVGAACFALEPAPPPG